MCLSVQHRAVEEHAEQLRGLIVGERGEGERGRVELAAAPAGPAFEQLGPCGRDDQERDVAQPVHELVEEVQETLVRPVDVLDDDDERPLLGETFEEAPPG